MVTITKMVVGCGYDSLTYAHHHPMWNRNVELTVPECARAVEYGKYKYDDREFSVNLKEDKTFTYFPGTQGVTPDSKCPTVAEHIVVDGVVYHEVYVEAHLSIRLRKVPGTLDTSTGVVSWSNGISADYAARVLYDSSEGTMTWIAKKPDCKATVSQLYHGDAVARRRYNDTYKDSVILIENEATKQYGGFLIKDTISICDAQCLTTQVDGILVCIILPFYGSIPDAKFNPTFAQLKADLFTRMSHMHITTNMRMNRNFESIQLDLCQTERRTNFNKLQAIAMRNPYALLDVYGRGHSIEVAGAVAYVTKCQPKEASIIAYPNCTSEIPLRLRSHNGSELVGDVVFADPLTWILKDFGTVIPCSDIHPVRWQVAGTWYCALSTGTIASTCVDSPGKLNVTTNIKGPGDPAEKDFSRGMGHSMWTPEMLQQHQKYRMAYHSRGAVVQKVTNAATNGDGHPQPYVLGSPLSSDDVSHLTSSLGGFFFPLFPLVGEAWFTVVTVMLIFTMVKIFATYLFRGYLLYREREGCGWWMAGVIIGATFHAVRTPFLIAKGAVNQAMNPADNSSVDLWVPTGSGTRSRSSSAERRVRLRLPGRSPSHQEESGGASAPGDRDPLSVSYSAMKKAAEDVDEQIVRPGESAEYEDETNE